MELKEKILKALVDRQGEFVSGADLSKLIGITRAGIWKHIENLRNEGYVIESQTRLGHKLVKGPLNQFALSKGLLTKRLGKRFVVLKQVDSTNKVAKELAKQGAEDGTVVISETQQGGKGRQGRSWLSPQGGIWMSLILRPGIELKDAACYTLLAGVAAARGLSEAAGIKVGIKWPNDLLMNGKKIGGILTEVQGEWQSVEYLVIGMGVNLNVQEEDLPPDLPATSIMVEVGRKVDLIAAVQAILGNLERLETLLYAEGFSGVLQEWREFAVCLNCEVVVKDASGDWPGHSVDISPDGSLLVRRADGELVKLYSADVSLRSKENNYNFAQ